jgi:hypothetical protein
MILADVEDRSPSTVVECVHAEIALPSFIPGTVLILVLLTQ